MISEQQARTAVESAYPGVKAVASATYKNLYLVRVEQADPDELDYDPFFSVNQNTGEVQEFSVLTDGDIDEIASLSWN